VRRMDFLPYHFLLCSVGEGGVLRYQVTAHLALNGLAYMCLMCITCHIAASRVVLESPTSLWLSVCIGCRGIAVSPCCQKWRLSPTGHEHRADRSAAQDQDGDMRCHAAEPLEWGHAAGPRQWRGVHVDPQHQRPRRQDALPPGAHPNTSPRLQ
jgi:hypothetical protein